MVNLQPVIVMLYIFICFREFKMFFVYEKYKNVSLIISEIIRCRKSSCDKWTWIIHSDVMQWNLFQIQKWLAFFQLTHQHLHKQFVGFTTFKKNQMLRFDFVFNLNLLSCSDSTFIHEDHFRSKWTIFHEHDWKLTALLSKSSQIYLSKIWSCFRVLFWL